MGLGHLAGHLRGDDGFQHHGLLRHLAGALHGAVQIVGQQHAGLVTADGLEPALPVAHHDAHPVAVRVGAHDEVRLHLVGQRHRQIEALGILRVGRHHRGEVAVNDHLLRHAVQVLDAQTGQCLRHQLVAAAVEGGIHHLERIRHLCHGIVVVDHIHHMAHEFPVRLFAQCLNEARLHRFVKGHALDTGENVDLLQLRGDGGGVMGRQLRAVLPIDLVAVILLGVVAGGDVDARLTAIFPHGKAQLRRGPQGRKNPHMDAVGGTYFRRGPGKLHGMMAAVHADGHAALLRFLALGTDDIGKALCGPADDVHVHLVQAHLHGAPQSGSTELQRAVKPALDLLLISGDGFQLLHLIGRQCAAVQPLFVLTHVIHHRSRPPPQLPHSECCWPLPAWSAAHTATRRSRRNR